MSDNFYLKHMPTWTAAGQQTLNILVTDGVVSSIENSDASSVLTDEQLPAATTVITGESLVAMPLAVDLSFRMNKRYGRITNKTLRTETTAAAKSGLGHVCVPPDTIPRIDVPSQVELLKNTPPGAASVHPIASMSNRLEGEEMADYGALKKVGAVAFSHGDYQFKNKQILLNIFSYAVGKKLNLFYHPIDESMTELGFVHRGYVADALGLESISLLSETAELAAILQMVEKTGVTLHIQHLSTARSVELVADAKARGVNVTADVGIAHLCLNEEAVKDFNVAAKALPVLRAEEDRQALLEGVKSGVIDSITSHHTPIKEFEKMYPFPEAAAGMSTLDVHVPLCLQLAKENTLDWQTLVNAMTFNPAGLINLDINIAVGKRFDLMIVDLNHSWRQTRQNLRSRGKVSYFIDWQFPAKPVYIFKDGLCLDI